MTIDREAAERAVYELLRALGYDPDADDELRETPARVVEAFSRDLLSGREVDLDALIRDGSSELAAGQSPGLVRVEQLSVATLCPHHLLPAAGTAAVSYLPGRRLLGLGTIAQLVDACARRLTLQESIGQQVVEALMRHAGARGARCELTLTHSCLSNRGTRQAGASVSTVAVAGELDAHGGGVPL